MKVTLPPDTAVQFVNLFSDSMFIVDVGRPKFSCEEAEVIAAVLVALDAPDAAAGWIDAHSCGDDDPDVDLHYRGGEPDA